MAERARAPKDSANGTGDPAKDEIEKLAKGRGKATKPGPGHNSKEPPDETIQTCASHIEAALIEIDEAAKVMASARGKLSAARKLTKKDCGSKAWADSIESAIKLKRAASKGGTGEIVTEHRQMGRVLRLLDSPLGTQFNLFTVADEPEASGAKNGPSPGMDAELQGQHAWANNEPISNNPFQPGTEEFVAWETGHNNAMAAHARKMKPGGEAAAH